MAPLWSVFISYSSDGPVAARLIDLLRQQLGRDYTVLVDTGFLRVGVPFDPKIRKTLRGASVGIVLLDRHAMNSEWVQRETSIMLEQRIAIRPVLIGTADDIEGSPFESLAEYQMCRLNENGEWLSRKGKVDATRTDPLGDVVAAIRSQMVTFDHDFTEDQAQLIRMIAQCLPEDDAKIADLIDELDGRTPDGRDSPFGGRELVAWRMLEARIDPSLVKLLSKHCYKFPGRAGLAKLIAPSWIPVGDATPIVEPPPDKSVFLIEPVDNDDTGEHYVRRATWWNTRDNDVVQADVMPMGEISDYSDQLDDLARGEPVCYWQQNLYGTRQYLVVKAGDTEAVTREAVEAVHERWPNAVVVLTAQTRRGQLAQVARSGVIGVDSAAESAAKEGMWRIRQAIQLADGINPRGR
jgi:hypothetical protein